MWTLLKNYSAYIWHSWSSRCERSPAAPRWLPRRWRQSRDAPAWPPPRGCWSWCCRRTRRVSRPCPHPSENFDFVLKVGHSRSLFVYFRLFNTVASTQMFHIKVCRWLDSNRGPLVSEATALPTEPQPLPKCWCRLMKPIINAPIYAWWIQTMWRTIVIDSLQNKSLT